MNHTYKKLITKSSALLLIASLSSAHAEVNTSCVNLENSSIAEGQLSYRTHNIFMHDDNKSIIRYQHFEAEEVATFQAWDSHSGKLIAQTKADNYSQRGHHRISFSSDNNILYLEAMNNGIPFWNIKKNHLVFSGCGTGMGVDEVQFSDDLSVVYSDTIDGFKSLCFTDSERKLVYMTYENGEYTLDKKEKHLYANFAHENKKDYQITLAKVSNDEKAFVSHYLFPHSLRHLSTQLSNNESLKSIFIGTQPNHKMFVSYTQGETLSLSLWDYANDSKNPKPIYQKSLTLPAIKIEKKLPSYDYNKSKIIKSADNRLVAFLSHTGVLLVFEVESGELAWQVNMSSKHNQNGKINHEFETFEQQLTDGGKKIVINRKEPRAKLRFDWKTGKQQTIEIDERFSLSSLKHYGKWSIMDMKYSAEAATETPTLAVIDFQTGKQSEVAFPKNYSFEYPIWLEERNELIFRPDIHHRKKQPLNAYSLFILNLDTQQTRFLTLAFDDVAVKYVRHYPLNGHDHLLVDTSKFIYESEQDTKGTKRTSVKLLNLDSQKVKSFDVSGSYLFSALDTVNSNSELLTFAYDKSKESIELCRFNLSEPN